MTDPTLADLLAKLSDAVDENRAASERAFRLWEMQADALWKDAAERRDELHESHSALSNQLENVQRTIRSLTTAPAEVAEKIVRLRDADA